MNLLAKFRILLFGTFCALLLASNASALSADTANPIRRDLDTGHAQDALNRIDTALAQNPQDAEALELRCRVLLQEQQWKSAVSDCQQAVLLEPLDSNAHMWMGRAYGEQARTSPKFAAFDLARKVHAEFEEAVKLDPGNAMAYDSLGSFYVQAPGIVGGGINKAQALERTLQTLHPAEGHVLAAKIAENHKDYPLAETEWKAAIQNSSYPAQAWMDLADFYRRRGNTPQMIEAAQTGASLDREHGVALVDGAALLLRTNQDLPVAAQWLQQYLDSPAQSEEAPAFAVHAQLAKVLQKLGNLQAAQNELAAAHDLAPGYVPHSR